MGDTDPRSEDALARTELDALSSDASRSGERPSEDLAGARLDHFHLRRRLGQGGMGSVWEGWDESLDRRVAVKVLRDDVTDKPGREDRFLREARAQARLNHPNVVHIYHIGHRPARSAQARPSLYLAMELIDGDPLDARLERGEPTEPEEARRLMIQVAQGLRAASAAGIVHRDVKPSNLILGKDGLVRIADFGLALPVEGDDVRITQDGALVGSPLTMSPEQARGQELDARSDMYSLGATFYHLLTGRPVFEGATGLAVIAQHLAQAPLPLRSVRRAVPAPLARIVDRLLEKDPADRYPDYAALLEALERAAPSHRAYAGFWTRAAAVLIDSLLAGALIWGIGWPGLVVHLAYVTIAHAFFGQTFAKYFLRIRVHRADGSRLGLPRALVRTVLSLWAPVVAGALIFWYQGTYALRATIEQLNPEEIEELRALLVALGISNGLVTLLWAAGLALAAFHPMKRAIHDVIVGSVVSYRLPAANGA